MNTICWKNKYFYIIFLVCILTYVCLVEDVTGRFQHKVTPTVNYLPSGEFLNVVSLGYDAVVADYLWVRSVIYFGDQVETHDDFRWVKHYFNLITELNPNFVAPYEFGGIVLAVDLKDVDASIIILNKGMRNVPQSYERYWLLTFYQAFNYMVYKEDYEKAAQYLKKTIKYQKAPKYIPILLTRLYAGAGNENLALDFIDSFQKTTDNQFIIDALQRRKFELRISSDIKRLQLVLKAFNDRYMFFPNHLETMVFFGAIKAIPIEPMGGKYFIGSDKIVRSTTLHAPLNVNKS